MAAPTSRGRSRAEAGGAGNHRSAPSRRSSARATLWSRVEMASRGYTTSPSACCPAGVDAIRAHGGGAEQVLRHAYAGLAWCHEANRRKVLLPLLVRKVQAGNEGVQALLDGLAAEGSRREARASMGSRLLTIASPRMRPASTSSRSDWRYGGVRFVNYFDSMLWQADRLKVPLRLRTRPRGLPEARAEEVRLLQRAHPLRR